MMPVFMTNGHPWAALAGSPVAWMHGIRGVHVLREFHRIEAVHQGNEGGLNAMYHIEAVDYLTQWGLVASRQKPSEA
jgi:hypothetical protein